MCSEAVYVVANEDTEEVRVWSPPFPKYGKPPKYATESPGVITPPMYSLDVQYTRRSGKNVVKQHRRDVEIGHIST